jgi:hypothetical protein
MTTMRNDGYRELARILATAFMTVALLDLARVRADTVLFTASTDNTGGANPISVPGTNNVNIPTISPGVTLNPNPALLDGLQSGPLGGVIYGPFGFGANGGGNTGWVSVSDTLSVTGLYQLIWEVAGADPKIGSALAIDNIRVNGNLLFGFEGGIPGGFGALGTVGTSGAVPVSDPVGGTNPPPFSPSEGSHFAYMDISGGITPIYDTVDPYLGSRLYSSFFNLNEGDVLTMDMAFLTNEGAPFYDYGIATLNFVPEPSGLVTVSIALTTVGLGGLVRRSVRRGRAA